MGDMDAGPVIGVVVVVVLLAILAITIALTISAARENSRVDTVRHRGVPVQVTVTGCQGVSSGVGMGIEYWQCRGTYSLDGRSYSGVIGGSRALLTTGQIVPAVAVPGQPHLLSEAAGGTHSNWKPYIAPIILGALFVAGGVALLWWSRRRHRTARRHSGAVEQTHNH
jgi:protein-S-isoprenylcysteine O-methyltransferase Ste14